MPRDLSDVDTLVLGGGGARGMAYVGALQELANVYDWWSADRRLKRVCGCSIGALYAAGGRLERFKALCREHDPDGKFRRAEWVRRVLGPF